ncbi:sporulation protein [Candidatus Uhrbacteria bacterium]|nr:sporulation protein [Candidatus Uhrbacteria bacterium]
MGFLDKVKGALNIGGSKMTINGPGTVQNGANLDFTAVLIGGKMEQNITSVQAQLIMSENQPQGMVNRGMNNAMQNSTIGSTQNKVVQTIAQDSVNQAFTIQPGEQKEFSFSLPVNLGGVGESGAGFMGALNKLNNMASSQRRMYKLKVTADIEGSTDASSEMRIDIQL